MTVATMAAASPFAHLFPGATAATAEDKKDDKGKEAKLKIKSKRAEGGDDSEHSDEVEDIEEDKKDEAEDEIADPDNADEIDEVAGDEDDAEEDDEDNPKPRQDVKKGAAKKAAVSPSRVKALATARAEGRAEGRRIERARCSRIFSSPHAGTNPAAAATLAFTTSMSSASAIGVMAAAALQAPKAPSGQGALRERMERTPNPKVGSGSGSEGAPSVAAQIVAAGKKRRGEA